jgi:hypothetical protein
MEVKWDPIYQKRRPIYRVPPPRPADKYCAFHDCNGHTTEGCISLRPLIEKFIENGKLVRFLVIERNQQDREWDRRDEEKYGRDRDGEPRCQERRERTREPTP